MFLGQQENGENVNMTLTAMSRESQGFPGLLTFCDLELSFEWE